MLSLKLQVPERDVQSRILFQYIRQRTVDRLLTEIQHVNHMLLSEALSNCVYFRKKSRVCSLLSKWLNKKRKSYALRIELRNAT